jgi:hypothetical protein
MDYDENECGEWLNKTVGFLVKEDSKRLHLAQTVDLNRPDKKPCEPSEVLTIEKVLITKRRVLK